jgi:hypothetical protein
MESLRALLRQADIDANSLAPLFDSAPEHGFEFVVSGSDAITTWHRLRERTPPIGYWPVLLGDDARLAQHGEVMNRLRRLTPEKILAEADTIDPVAWFENRYLDELDDLRRRLADSEGASDWIRVADLLAAEGPLRGLPQGPWDDGPRSEPEFRIPLQYPSRVHVGLVPTGMGWQTPAYLRFGAWGACPSPGENVALLEYWEEHYGAGVVGLAGDMMELRVARPPQTENAALDLAKQQYLYCPDIVTLGTKTVQRLAGSLLDSTIWPFQWRSPHPVPLSQL